MSKRIINYKNRNSQSTYYFSLSNKTSHQLLALSYSSSSSTTLYHIIHSAVCLKRKLRRKQRKTRSPMKIMRNKNNIKSNLLSSIFAFIANGCLLANLDHVECFSASQLPSSMLSQCNTKGDCSIIRQTSSPISALSIPNSGNVIRGRNRRHQSTKLNSTKERNKHSSMDSAAIKAQEKDEKSTKKSKNAMKIYLSYVTRLWNETNTTQRKRTANQKAYHAIRQVQHLLREGEEYVNIMNHHEDDTLDKIEIRTQAKIDLLHACDSMLDILGTNGEGGKSMNVQQNIDPSVATPGDVSVKTNPQNTHSDSDLEYTQKMITEDLPIIHKAIDVVKKDEEGKVPEKKKKKSRSVSFGALMGAVVAGWVFSGNQIFASLFCFATILAQLEYYRMLMKVGIYPARKISVVGATAMFITVSNFLWYCLQIAKVNLMEFLFMP